MAIWIKTKIQPNLIEKLLRPDLYKPIRTWQKSGLIRTVDPFLVIKSKGEKIYNIDDQPTHFQPLRFYLN